MKGYKHVLCALLALSLLATAGCAGGGTVSPSPDTLAQQLAAPVYPEMAPYPDESKFFDRKGTLDDEAFSQAWDAWREDLRAWRSTTVENAGALDAYAARSMTALLSGAGGENRVCSPVNLYMALAMLAQITDGDSRQQILDLLGSESMEDLRRQAEEVWTACYCDDGATTSVLANSLWLDEDLTYEQGSLDTLAEGFRAFSYQGKMGSAELDRALQSWLSQQTGGLLDDQLSSITTDPEAVLALASAVYFRAKWSDPFSESRTEKGLFSLLSPEGETVECSFLRRKSAMNYYWGETFSAVSLPFEQGGQMWLILPDAGVSVDELLSDGEAGRFLRSNGDWEQSKYLQVDLSLPKFDVSSQLDLIPGLKSLGVRDIFDFDSADFSPLTDGALAVTKALHGARVKVDEEGCEAAAYTAMLLCGSAMPPDEEIAFTLDRPFLFTVTTPTGLPLFAGVVNRPA